MDFLECDDPARYKTLWYSLRNNYLTGTYHYPNTLNNSLNLLIHYRTPVTHTIPCDGGGNQRGTNVQFTQVKGTDQQREAISRTDRNTRGDVTCYNCQCPGDIHLFLPNGANIQTFQFSLNQSEVLIPIGWVPLGYGYNISSICNVGLVDNIQYSNVTTTVHNNGDSKDYTQNASLHLLPLYVHFNSTSFVNILSLSEVDSHYQVTMDTTFESAFNVHTDNHTIVKFLKFGPELYYFDTVKSNKSPVNTY